MLSMSMLKVQSFICNKMMELPMLWHMFRIKEVSRLEIWLLFCQWKTNNFKQSYSRERRNRKCQKCLDISLNHAKRSPRTNTNQSHQLPKWILNSKSWSSSYKLKNVRRNENLKRDWTSWDWRQFRRRKSPNWNNCLSRSWSANLKALSLKTSRISLIKWRSSLSIVIVKHAIKNVLKCSLTSTSRTLKTSALWNHFGRANSQKCGNLKDFPTFQSTRRNL